MNNLKQRTLTGIALILVIIIFINLGVYTFVILLLTINLGGLFEFYRLVQVTKAGMVIGTVFGTFMVLTIVLILAGLLNLQILLIQVPVIFLIYVTELYSNNQQPFKNLAYTFMGLIYVTLPLCFFAALAFLPCGEGYGTQLVSGCFFMIWADDTGAYVIGNYLGRHPLFERISPHKTWEGSIGGMMSTLLVATVLSHYFLILPLGRWLALSMIIVITGTYGDFFKSMLKRSLHVKDTGNWLPGHGGILDRFDSMLGSAPFLLSYLVLYGHFTI